MTKDELTKILNSFNYEPCVGCEYAKGNSKCYEHWQENSTTALCPIEVDKLTDLLMSAISEVK